MIHKKRTSFALSEKALTLLKQIAEKKGLSMASALELIIREYKTV
jgi:predicted transcriptional regulator